MGSRNLRTASRLLRSYSPLSKITGYTPLDILITDKLTDRQTDRQAGRHTGYHNHYLSYFVGGGNDNTHTHVWLLYQKSQQNTDYDVTFKVMSMTYGDNDYTVTTGNGVARISGI